MTSFEFTAQPVTTVHFGMIGYQPTDLPRFIAGWRDLVRTGDENLTTTLNLLPSVPGPGRRSCCSAATPAPTATPPRPRCARSARSPR